jgi:hypothetical protein
MSVISSTPQISLLWRETAGEAGRGSVAPRRWWITPSRATAVANLPLAASRPVSLQRREIWSLSGEGA